MNIRRLEQFRPTLVAPKLVSYDAGTLIRKLQLPDGRLGGFTFDLDGTLVKPDEDHISLGNLELLAHLRGEGKRLGFIADIGDRDDFADQAQRRTRAENLAGEASEFCHIGIIATICGLNNPGKPHKRVFEQAAENMGLPAGRVVHVGDQLLQDVRGANRAGYAGSVLVRHYGSYEDWREQFREAVVRRVLGLPLLSRNFGKPTH